MNWLVLSMKPILKRSDWMTTTNARATNARTANARTTNARATNEGTTDARATNEGTADEGTTDAATTDAATTDATATNAATTIPTATNQHVKNHNTDKQFLSTTKLATIQSFNASQKRRIYAWTTRWTAASRRLYFFT